MKLCHLGFPTDLRIRCLLVECQGQILDERCKRTKTLIELGGLVIKAGFVDLTGNDRAIILGALIWIADKLRDDEA